MTDHPPSPERLAAVAKALDGLDLSLAGTRSVAAAAEARRLIGDYLLPRSMHAGGDVVVAVVGVAGAGKSTLINSLARRRVSPAGTMRPATTEPIAWGGDSLPPTLDALRRRLPGKVADGLVGPPAGVVLIDTPPPDVLGPAGLPLCHEVLDAADACIVVTAANRYADAAGIELISRARRRGMDPIVVVNRLPAASGLRESVIDDLQAKLSRRGLAVSAIISVTEGPISAERQGLATDAVLDLRKELDRLGGPDVRPAVLATVRVATARTVANLLGEVRAALVIAAARRAELLDPVRLAYAAAAEHAANLVTGGGFADLKEDGAAVESAVASAASRQAGRAAWRVAARWQDVGASPTPGLFTHGDPTLDLARERYRWWESDIPRLAEEVSGRRVRRRRLADLVAATRAAVLDPAHQPKRRERRLLRRHPGLVAAAGDRLANEIAGIITTDATRFAPALGPGLPAGSLATLDVGSGHV